MELPVEIFNDSWLRLGAIVVFAWFALKVFEGIYGLVSLFLKKNEEEDKGGIMETLVRIEGQLSCVTRLVKDLHEWHDVKDPRTGTLVWYSAFQNSALQDTLVKVGATLEGITDVLRELATQQREAAKDQGRMLATLEDRDRETRDVLKGIRSELGDVKSKLGSTG